MSSTKTITPAQLALIEKMRDARLKCNSTGFPGVRKFRNLWHARVTVNGKRISSRGYQTKAEAAAWRARQLTRGEQVAA